MLIHQLLNLAEVAGSAVLYILIGLSVISMAIAFERLIWFNRRRVDSSALGRAVAARLRDDDVAGAKKLLLEKPSVEGAVIAEGLDWSDRGHEAMREVMEAALRERKKEFERGLLYLGTLGNNAPFVGLFGTVLGIVSAFRELGTATGNNAQMGNVMGGIAEALVATAVGIIVALPAVVAYNYFNKRAGAVEENVATLSNYVFAQLKGQPLRLRVSTVPLREPAASATATGPESPTPATVA
jgi:biopolymer transport protein ExbB/biopolymer transport protein TolQ